MVSLKGNGPMIDLKTPFLSSATPYLDPQTVAKRSAIRDTERSKWVDKKDFVVSPPKPSTARRGQQQADELPGYLNAGVVYRDGGSEAFLRGLRSEKNVGKPVFKPGGSPLKPGVDVTLQMGATPFQRKY
jgi:hypothetical protein